MENDIVHDAENKMFKVQFEGAESYIKYALSDSSLNILSTFVPPEHRGQKLAKKLTVAAFEYAKENSLKVIPTCSYARAFVEKNPEYSVLVK